MNEALRATRTLTYIVAAPGESIFQVAQEANRNGVEYFLHNDRLFRTRIPWEEIGKLEDHR